MKIRQHSTTAMILSTLVITGVLAGVESRPCLAQANDGNASSDAEDAKEDEPLEQYVSPEEIVRDAFEAPPNAKSLSKRSLWVDRDLGRVYVDGYVAMRDGPLEMFACPIGTKEHESVVATLARSSEVHAALLAVGAKSGTPVAFLPKFVPATGQRIRVWVCYRDSDGKFRAIDARKWVRRSGTQDEMESEWVFAGSGFWKDPSNGREYYRADSGDMICVSNFNTAMMDVTISSSAEADELQFSPFTDRIPNRGTPVRLVLAPIPLPSGKPDEAPKTDASKPPEEKILPVKTRPLTKAKP